jgi:hypothetical protein|tara:strand:+ start:4022 stop:4438 length:417 start_codon:yes stop_codon:yes gene_type:complete
MGNPVWNKYILTSLPSWLRWFANNPTKSHIHIFEKFLMANPYYLPILTELETGEDQFILSLIYNKTFIESLSNKGLQVWYYSDFKDFLNTLKPYTSKSHELRLLYNCFLKNIWWFDRVYSSIRNQLAEELETNGKEFR